MALRHALLVCIWTWPPYPLHWLEDRPNQIKWRKNWDPSLPYLISHSIHIKLIIKYYQSSFRGLSFDAFRVFSMIKNSHSEGFSLFCFFKAEDRWITNDIHNDKSSNSNKSSDSSHQNENNHKRCLNIEKYTSKLYLFP